MFNIIIKQSEVTITNKVTREEREDELDWKEMLRKQDDLLGEDWSAKEEHRETNWWSEQRKAPEGNEMEKNAEGGVEGDERFIGETAGNSSQGK